MSFEDFLLREFSKDIDQWEPDLNASFYLLKDQPSQHPAQVFSEHKANNLDRPVRKGFSTPIPDDPAFDSDPLEECYFKLIQETHCELKVDEKELRAVAKAIYDQKRPIYELDRKEIWTYIEGCIACDDLEWKKLFEDKPEWEKDLERFQKQKQKK